MKAHVTDHAAERYRERFAPDITVARAKWTLIGLLRDARKMGIPAAGGGEYVMLHEGSGIVGIVAPSKTAYLGLVTVISREDMKPEHGDVDPWEVA